MSVIEIAPQLRTIVERLEGDTLDQKLARLICGQLRRYLEECEREMLGLEIKYGLGYEEFREKLAVGELGDEFSYPLEEDAMRWDDLRIEKKHWLVQLKSVEELV